MSFATYILTRGMATSPSYQAAVKNIVVIGSGLMGGGIAQVAAQTGHNVTMVDLNDQLLQKSSDIIKTSVSRVAKKKFGSDQEAGNKFISSTLDHIKLSTDTKGSVKEADLIIEAIVENLEIKQRLFEDLDAVAPQHTIFTSNTSSLLIGEIASNTKRKDRFGGLHFFNPVPVMKLLEVVRIAEQSEETYKKLMDFGNALGKTCVTSKDTPGFIVNRLLGPYMAESVRMLERGDATAPDIDTAMKLGAGYPMGPFELSDYVGLDTRLFVQEAWSKRFPNNPMYSKSELIEKLVKEGKLGRKSGEGFYKYKK